MVLLSLYVEHQWLVKHMSIDKLVNLSLFTLWLYEHLWELFDDEFVCWCEQLMMNFFDCGTIWWWLNFSLIHSQTETTPPPWLSGWPTPRRSSTSSNRTTTSTRSVRTPRKCWQNQYKQPFITWTAVCSTTFRRLFQPSSTRMTRMKWMVKDWERYSWYWIYLKAIREWGTESY